MRAVPFDQVKVTDAFWLPRMETNRTVTLPHNLKLCEETGRIERFITVANRDTADHGATILAGNEKVLSARLADAKFFWENDLRTVRTAGLEGMAEPLALLVATAASQAAQLVGMPECQYNLAQACIHLATAPKSNSAQAYFEALDAVRKGAVHQGTRAPGRCCRRAVRAPRAAGRVRDPAR